MSLITIPALQQPEQFTVTNNIKQQHLLQWLNKYYINLCTYTQVSDSQHIRSLKGGFQLQFKKGDIETVFAYFRTPKFTCFEGWLKYGINAGWTIKGAVMYLGQPPEKNHKITEIIYPHLGLGIVFQGIWSNEQSPIQYCYIFKEEGEPCCAGCGKIKEKMRHKCRCSIVSYCDNKCFKKHYGQHLIFCEEGSPP